MTVRGRVLSGCIFAGFLTVSAAALSQQINCETPQSTADQRQCVALELSKANAELQNTFAEALQKFKPSADEKKEDAMLPKYDRKQVAQYDRRMRRDIKKSQKAWLHYRAEACQSIHDLYENGTIVSEATSSCEVALTQERIKFLRNYFIDQNQ